MISPFGRLLPGGVARSALAFVVAMAGDWMPVQQQTVPPQAPPVQYVIGAQDTLVITVVGFPDMSGKFGVNQDGTFTFPNIGRVQAAGLSTLAVERELTKRLDLGGYVVRPEVTVSLEQSGSKRYFAMGEVRQPGRFTITGEVSLIEALARAGFVTPEAGREVLVYRGAVGADGAPAPTAPGRGEVARVDLRDLESGKLSTVVVRDGDLIVVPRVDVAYVFGFVRTNGSFAVRKDTTVLQLIALAGGVTERGAMNRVYIVRQVNGAWEEVTPKPTDFIQPGDVIVVPEKRI